MDEKFMKVLREQQEIQQKAARILHDTEKMKEEVQNKLESLKRKVENDFKNIGEFLKEANVQFVTYEYIFQEDDCKRIQINEQKYQTYGTPYDVSSSYHFTKAELNRLHADCVHAHAGTALRNDEIIFFDENAMVLNYIVEFQ